MILLLSAVSIHAQQANTGVELYRCQSAVVSYMDNNQQKNTTYDVDYIISVDIDNKLVKVDNNKGTEIYLSVLSENIKGTDKDGNEYVKVVWGAKDENGLACELTSFDYPNLPNRVFQLRYNDLICAWYTVIIKRGSIAPQTTASTGQRI